MGNQIPVKTVVVSSDTADKNQAPVLMAFLDESGDPLSFPKQAAAQANSTATDVAGLVTDFNALLAKLRTAGVIAP